LPLLSLLLVGDMLLPLLLLPPLPLRPLVGMSASHCSHGTPQYSTAQHVHAKHNALYNHPSGGKGSSQAKKATPAST
jgi:hypothetical protein